MDERAFDLQSEIDRIGARITKPHAHGSNVLTQLRNFNRLSAAQQQSLPGIVYAYQEWLADEECRAINVPVVSVECKTYIDKTMLEGSIATAEKIKMGNPHCLFLVVTEWYEVSYEVDPKYSRIDQIYVLRREKRRVATRHPIYSEVVIDLFDTVHAHLERDWSRIEEKMTREGKIL